MSDCRVSDGGRWSDLIKNWGKSSGAVNERQHRQTNLAHALTPARRYRSRRTDSAEGRDVHRQTNAHEEASESLRKVFAIRWEEPQARFLRGVALTDQKMYVWQSSLAVLDIAGTIAHVDEPMSDDELRRELDGTQVLVANAFVKN